MNNSCVNLQGYCNRGCDMYNFRQTDVNAFFLVGWLKFLHICHFILTNASSIVTTTQNE